MSSPDDDMPPVKHLTKKSWTPDEDQLLIALINEHGTKNWSIIANRLPNRIGKQCRERWCNHLDPNIKKGDWTEEEDEIIIQQQRLHGNQWSKITKMLPGRTDNAVKNRWHATSRARSRTNSMDASSPMNRPVVVDKAVPVYGTSSPQVASAYYSDSDLYLDADCLASLSKNATAPVRHPTIPPAVTSNNSGVGWLIYAKSEASDATMSDDESDDMIVEWVQALKFPQVTTTNTFARTPPKPPIYSDGPTGDVKMMELSEMSSAQPPYVMLCPSPKKTHVDSSVPNRNYPQEVHVRSILSPDIMSDEYVMDVEALPQAMELCLSPPLDRITICSPETMTMRGIQFEYRG